MRRSLVVAVLVALVTLAAPSPSPASCPRVVQPLGVWFEQADAVFVGRVLEVVDVPVSPPPGESPDVAHVEITTRFHVDELFKGDIGEDVTVLASKTWRDCIVEFDEGEQYVVFAFRRGRDGRTKADGELRSDDSSPTARVSARADAVAYLRYRAANGREPSLVGTVYDRTPASLDGLYGQTHLGWYGVTTRSGVPVSLAAGDRKLETVSDANGAFVFGDVPAGTYSIRIELPAGHRLLEQHSDLLRHPAAEAPDRVTVKAGETSVRYFTVTGAASVVGRALAPSGEPIERRYVHLVLASAIDSFQPNRLDDNLRAFIEGRGAFEFDVVPPGEYLLLVNPGYTAFFDTSGPTFYHPGVTDPAKATRLRISEGKRFDLGDVKAPADTAYRPVDVAVVDVADRGRQTGLHCTPVEPAGERLFFLTDEAGHARLYLPPGVRFRIEVEPGSEVRLVGAPVETGAERTLSPVKLLVEDAPPEDGESEEP